MSEKRDPAGLRDASAVDSARPPVRVLFLCTGNSARSQIAEALLSARSGGRFEAGSAGVDPRSDVHPDAVSVLAEYGIEWRGRQPKSIDDVKHVPWDLVITVCDNAKESCPVMPGQPVFAHWGMPDPAEIADDDRRRTAFRETLQQLRRRIDLLTQLPPEKLAPPDAARNVADILRGESPG